eukprot:3411407-Pyramimonas_sp.AAC.1
MTTEQTQLAVERVKRCVRLNGLGCARACKLAWGEESAQRLVRECASRAGEPLLSHSTTGEFSSPPNYVRSAPLEPAGQESPYEPYWQWNAQLSRTLSHSCTVVQLYSCITVVVPKDALQSALLCSSRPYRSEIRCDQIRAKKGIDLTTSGGASETPRAAMVIAADVVYDQDQFYPLAACMAAMADPATVVLLGYRQRTESKVRGQEG